MERLTTKGYKYNSLDFMDDGIHYFANKLSRYEDTGLTPEEIMDVKSLTGWIPVSERLPEPETDVLVQWEKYDRFSGDTFVYFDHMWRICNEDGEAVFESPAGIPSGRVVAWMPLPEPYRSDSPATEWGKKEIMKYRKKPVVIEAIEWNGDVEAVMEFMGEHPAFDNPEVFYNEGSMCSIMIQTLEGTMECAPYDYIIKGINGEFYPCKPDIFEKTYDLVED